MHPATDRSAPGVRATGLGKQFGDKWALRDVDLVVPQGTVLGLLGHNGAGKTTRSASSRRSRCRPRAARGSPATTS